MEFPLAGERVLLRPFESADTPVMHAMYSDPGVMRWVGAGPVRDLSGTQEMLRDYAAHQREHGFSCWAVVERSTGTVIGDAGLSRRDGEVELGYTLARSHWKRGYGTEAARLCVATAFGELGLGALIALVRPENSASRSVLTKLGFQPDGLISAYGAPHRLYRLASG